MKIIFDLRRTGLGHNGGSLTLIKSGNTLVDLGHEVYFIDSGRNQNKWEPLRAKHVIVQKDRQIPDSDIIMATGYKSVGPVVSAPDRCGKKFMWMRAWETWQMPVEKIIRKILKAPLTMMVNGIDLQDELLRHGNYPSYIIRPGYDFEDLWPRSIRQFNNSVIIGGLYREGIHGQRKRTSWLFETVKALRARKLDVQFWLMGSEGPPKISQVDRYLRQPTMAQKNDFYNYVNIWMAPTMSEGLHLPPAEAGMTGCPSVATTAPLAGVRDYIIHDVSGILTKNNLEDFINGVELLVNSPDLRAKYTRGILTRLSEIGDRAKNMKEMVSLFERSISGERL